MRLGLDLVVRILPGDAYGVIGGRSTSSGYAKAPTAPGTRILTTDLVPVLHEALGAGGVHLVTVPVDYPDNVRVLVDELHTRVPTAAEVPQP